MARSLRSRTRDGATPPPFFSKSEIEQMERILLKKKYSLDQTFYQKLTNDFNLAPGRVGSKTLQMEQVQKWFEDKQKPQTTEASDTPEDSNLAKGTSIDAEEKIFQNNELEFEAKSSKDNAWYDVAMFLAHRCNSDEQLEALVRYEGYGAGEDEWVNITQAIRQRSIPLESSECRQVAVGDLVLCFRETNNLAAHFDAHVLEIERKLHDIRGCRCRFLVRYDHDNAEVNSSTQICQDSVEGHNYYWPTPLQFLSLSSNDVFKVPPLSLVFMIAPVRFSSLVIYMRQKKL